MGRLPYTYLLIFYCFTFLCTFGGGQGTGVWAFVNSTISPPKVYVVRDSTFNLGSDANLACSDKTWIETMYVIWKITLENRECRISFNNDGRLEDSCNDGKSLQNTSRAQSYLHIPNFSNDDVGIYRCESVFTGGNENYKINVAITDPPSISAWLERENNKMVAVCMAEGAKPAANISWSHRGNSSSVEELSESHGFFTVKSRLELTEGMDINNLTCAVSHPYWTEEQILVPKAKKGCLIWQPILIVSILIVGSTGLYFYYKTKRR